MTDDGQVFPPFDWLDGEHAETYHLGQVPPEDLTASGISPVIEEGLKDFYDIIGSGRHALTLSQERKLRVYIGNFQELKRQLMLLIQNSVDRPNLCDRLLQLNDMLNMTLEVYDIRGILEIEPNDQLAEKFQSDLHRIQLYELFAANDDEQQQQQQQQQEAAMFLEKLEEPEDPRANERLECPICTETVVRRDGVALLCEHFYCKTCIEEYATNRIESGLALKLVCPDPSCKRDLTETELQKVLNDREFARYQQFRFLAALQAEPNCRWCPKADCNTPFIASPELPNFPQLTCPRCAYAYCFHCQREWHPKFKCNEYTKHLKTMGTLKEENQKATERWLAKNKVFRCPQCNADIEKNEGCNHMTCKCGYQFCWICRGPYSSTHYSSGSCKGLQFSNHPMWDKYGKKIAIAGGVAVAVPFVAGGAIVVLCLAIPAACVGLPIYGAYRIVKALND